MDGFKKNEEELKKYVEEYKIKLRKSVSGTVSISEYYRYRVPVSNIEGLLLNYVPILFLKICTFLHKKLLCEESSDLRLSFRQSVETLFLILIVWNRIHTRDTYPGGGIRIHKVAAFVSNLDSDQQH